MQKIDENVEKTSTGIENILPPSLYRNCVNILETVIAPLRARFPDLSITSWYRCPELNKAVGGAPASSHMTGEGVDLYSPSNSLSTLLKWIHENLKVDYIKVYKTHLHITKKNVGDKTNV